MEGSDIHTHMHEAHNLLVTGNSGPKLLNYGICHLDLHNKHRPRRVVLSELVPLESIAFLQAQARQASVVFEAQACPSTTRQENSSPQGCS